MESKKSNTESKRSSFGGSLGFVLAAAGSAVGLGNIWRFPYLAAKDGGGLFLVVYLVLALTFGFTLLTAEITIGRKTKQSPLTAYKKLNKKFGWLGVLACVVPFLIMPYYCAIGGWVLKYFIAFLTGHGADAAQDGYFGSFISGKSEPVIMTFIFLAVCAVIVYRGVNSGIEKTSKVLMPILIMLVIGIAIFSLKISETGEDGKLVTGFDGMKVYVVPSLKGVDIGRFLEIVMDALGQLFYSLSIAMGVMIAYGSYVPDDANLSKSVNQIEIFDSVIAFLAGVMIIPAIYVFQGKEGMEASGPSLMFVSLPKVFAKMGGVGDFIGTLFFAMVLFAAVTSAVSMFEAVVSSIIDKFGIERKKATICETVLAGVTGMIVCFGYNIFKFDIKLPNGSHAQILDILDYISNYIMMPVVAISTCILIGWVVKPKTSIDEITKNGERFRRKGVFTVMIKYAAPVMLTFLLIMALGLI